MAGLWNKMKSSATLMTWSNQFINLGSTLFILPLLLTKFDALEISFWFLVNIFMQLARLADSGFGPTLIRAVSFFKAGSTDLPLNKEDFENQQVAQDQKPNFQKLRDLLSTSNWIYMILSWISVFLIGTLGLLILWNILEKGEFRQDFIISFCIIVVNSFIVLQTVKWSAFMTGLDFVAKINGFRSAVGSVRVFAYISILLIEPNIVYLLIYNLLTNIVILIYARGYVRKWLAGKQFPMKGYRVFDREIFSAIWPATWKLGTISWGVYLVNYGISIIIAQVDDTLLMASFLFTQRLIFIIRRMSEAPFYANIHKIYKLMAIKKYVELKKLASVYIFLSFSIMAISLTGIGLVGNWALEFINVDMRLVPLTIYAIMVVGIILEVHASMMASIYTSTNHVPFLIPSLASGIVMFSLGFVVLPHYGLMGVILLQFVIQFTFNYWYSTYLSLRLVNWPFLTYIGDLFRNGMKFIIHRNQAI